MTAETMQNIKAGTQTTIAQVQARATTAARHRSHLYIASILTAGIIAVGVVLTLAAV